MTGSSLLKLPSLNNAGEIIVCPCGLLQHIRQRLAGGISIFEISVSASEMNNIADSRSCCLTRLIWQNYLMKSYSNCGMYIEFLTSVLAMMSSFEAAIISLHSNADLCMQIKLYHHDLRMFNERQAQERLLNTSNDLFMSDCYFTTEERAMLLAFPTARGLCLLDLFVLMKEEKMKRGGEHGILCTSHDIAPLIEQTFKLRKGYEKEKTFRDKLKLFNKKK